MQHQNDLERNIETCDAWTSPRNDKWVELKEAKQFSRLLYTNPVCFLCTWTQPPGHNPNATSTAKEDASANYSAEGLQTVTTQNVMVLSWLTATNNHGRFMFSINRRRFSASLLYDKFSCTNGCDFVLCVPVQGMEELVRNVGSVSARWGHSKFPQDASDPQSHQYQAGMQNLETGETTKQTPMQSQSHGQRESKRQKKKNHASKFIHGIPGLQRVAFGHRVAESSVGVVENEVSSSHHIEDIFAIGGTVAHLHCRIHRILHDDNLIDSEHYLVLADVKRACVHADYWNGDKNIFQSRLPGFPPYLTFFGSQTFGYAHPAWAEADK